MEADLILQALETELTPLVKAAGGSLDVCGTPADTLELLEMGPVNWRCILQWGGDDSSGTAMSEANVEFKVVLQAVKGFQIHQGADVYKARSNNSTNFIRLAALLRGWVRRIVFVSAADPSTPHPHVDCKGLLPQSMKWLGGGLEELSAVRIAVLTFTLKVAIDHQIQHAVRLAVTDPL